VPFASSFQWMAQSVIERPGFYRGFTAVGRSLADVKEFAALVRTRPSGNQAILNPSPSGRINPQNRRKRLSWSTICSET
jgi:hypothetical protein